MTHRLPFRAALMIVPGFVLAFGLVTSAGGAVISTVDVATSQAELDALPSSTDLLEVSGSTVSLVDYTPNNAGTGNSGDILRDGDVGVFGGLAPAAILLETSGGAANGWTATYALDTSVNTAGYDITSVSSISALTFGNLDAQSFDLFVNVIGTGWIEIGDGFTGNASPDGGVRVNVFDDSAAPLATNVDGVRFVSTGALRGTYRELDVFGTASPITEIPEPASVALLALGGCVLMVPARRGK